MLEDEVQTIRRTRLADWLKANGGSRHVCENHGLPRSVESHISQIVGGYSFGPRAARSMEKKLGMDDGHLDNFSQVMRSEFGQRLFEARTYVKLTQTELAKAVGMSQSTYAELEQHGQGSAFTPAIAERCGVSVNWLAYGKGSASEPDATLENVVADGLKVSGIALIGRLSNALEAQALSESQIRLLAHLIEEFSAN